MSDLRSELQSSLSGLDISKKGPLQDITRPNMKTTAPAKPKKAKKPVLDSWDDETESSGDEPTPLQDGASSSTFLSPTISAEGPLDPPPTPISPQTSQPWGAATSAPTSEPPSASSQGDPARRPEKQTAVAGRLIAGALGIRAPKRTEEQRAYDRATKEQEIKRRNREREDQAKAKEEEERAKASVWTD
ncbi:uncharacterized protein N7498_005277 [Penicillium cinerascens]|uniref:Ubiquitin smt3 n=1 Tax=Penicillium cinerascens TaxID=70096 RepID=A0A9W9MN55_9EURO|nr:uncharacterized protein N7498_005277 [Penicillium cinerascens]KAJ5204398.1 hypothetical protein N7498_005277 [Penicillium cinerascens]